MSPDAWLVCGILVVALVLFVLERVPIDQVAISIPVVLLAFGVLTPSEAIAGFSNPATMTVAAMLVLSLGLVQAGAVRRIARWAQTAHLGPPWMRLLLLCALVSVVSPFLNNTPVVLIFLPVFLAVAKRLGEAPSRYLIPLSYSAILGGTVTIIGTSTNLIVYGIAYERGYRELGMFSISMLGLIYLGTGLLYLGTVGRWLLPRRGTAIDLSSKYDVRRFLTEVRLPADAPAVGKTLRELGWGEAHGVTVVGISREAEVVWAPGGRHRLYGGDVLLLRGDSEQLLALASAAGMRPITGGQEKDPLELGGRDQRMVEVLIAPDSPLVGRTLGELRFQRRNWATVLGIQRAGEPIQKRLADVRLRAGDLLLLHGSATILELLADEDGIVPLSHVRSRTRTTPRAAVAAGIMAAVVLIAAFEVMNILSAALIGVVLMLFCGCVRMPEVYERLDWMVVFLLAGLIPLGTAMEKTGLVHAIVESLTVALGGLRPELVILLVYLLTSLLTSIMSNNATAIVLTPVALGSAAELGINPYAMLVAVMFGASAAFMTPMSYQTNTLVYGPGGYRFTDYLKVGAPLNILLAIVASILIPRMWP